MTKQEKQSVVDSLTNSLLVQLDSFADIFAVTKQDAERYKTENRQTIAKLIAASRELGKDFSGVIR